ncbi:MAG: ATP-dependent DNA helicase [Nanoarchaeota archaeon]
MSSYIQRTNGPCAIIAGAGTGKTRSIIEKLKYIIENKIYPIEKVVCLTFSNEAVNNLIERIIPYIKSKEPIIRTFHSFCADLLREHGEKIGIKKNFRIITPDEGKILLHKYFKVVPILCNKYIDKIGMLKDLGKSITNFEKNSRNSEDIAKLSKELEEINFKINTSHINKISKFDLEKIKEESDTIEKEIKDAKFIQTWKSYEKIKLANNGLDYSDLHNKALELLTENHEIADDFEYVIVDEFQDTNKIQCSLLDKIAKKRNITVVGDLNQSIYRFRGAYEDNFKYFREIMNLKKEDIFRLDKSYRSTNNILDMAHELIQNNYKNKEDCFNVKNAHNIEGEKTKIYELKNSKEEVRKIIEIIKEEISKNTPLKQICVIFRTHQQSSMLKKQLEYENIPYTSINKDSLLKDQKIRLVRSYLTIVEKISSKSKGGESSIWEIVNQSIKDTKDNFNITQEIKKWKDKKELICEEFINHEFDLSENGKIQINLIKYIINSIIENSKLKSEELIKKSYELLGIGEKDSVPSLEKFHKFVKELPENEAGDLSGLIYHLNTIDSLGINIEAPELVKDGIKIMTNHSTKGLEYDVVIMSSIVQKKFPIERIDKKDSFNEETDSLESQISEERRLCYVGFTRAKKRLYLTFAKEYGQRKYEPSQFLNEISYIDNKSIQFIKDDSESYQTPDINITPIIEINDGYVSFSPSSLQIFDECEKRYEMKYIYNMPDPTPQSWEAITLGTFIHKVLDKAVKNKCKSLKEIEDIAKIIQISEYKELNINESMLMIKVFFERNKKMYDENSMTEKSLRIKIEGLTFTGFADRIDISENGEVTIVDYKTGKYDIKPRYRNWQLGIYAMASKEELGKPKRLILDMLQKETPLEFELDDQGIAKEIHSARTYFNLNEVKKEIVETAKKIMIARKTGFRFCQVEKNCQFCEDLMKK